jgi:hypothetical protein
VIPLKQARIGYAGYSRDFSAPGDRRRFLAYARERELSFEYPKPGAEYDLVIVTQNADLTGWTARRSRPDARFRLVVDLVDSYFEQKRLDERFLKGVGRFAERRDSRLSPDFRATLKRACRVADAVFCSTPEQEATIAAYNGRIAQSFDWFAGELGPRKTDYRRAARLKLVWEGQLGTLRSIRELREPLNALRDRLELHVVTDPRMARLYGRLGTIRAEELLRGFECPVTVTPWRKEDFWKHVQAADVAVIPMDLRHRMIRAKPDNKLVLLWKLGMPVLTGATRAYRRAMEAAGLDMVCEGPTDWQAKLERLVDTTAEDLARLGGLGYEHAQRAYGLADFCTPFDRVFAELGFAV